MGLQLALPRNSMVLPTNGQKSVAVHGQLHGGIIRVMRRRRVQRAIGATTRELAEVRQLQIHELQLLTVVRYAVGITVHEDHRMDQPGW